jgi:hypothetical protein
VTRCSLLLVLAAKRIQRRDGPNRGLSAVTAPMRASAFADADESGLICPVIIATTQDKMRFRPNNLSANLKTRILNSSGYRP